MNGTEALAASDVPGEMSFVAKQLSARSNEVGGEPAGAPECDLLEPTARAEETGRSRKSRRRASPNIEGRSARASRHGRNRQSASTHLQCSAATRRETAYSRGPSREFARDSDF